MCQQTRDRRLEPRKQSPETRGDRQVTLAAGQVTIAIVNVPGFCSVSKNRQQREEDVTVSECHEEPEEHRDDEWDMR